MSNNVKEKQENPCFSFVFDHPVIDAYKKNGGKYKYFVTYKEAFMSVSDTLRSRSIWVKSRIGWVRIRRRSSKNKRSICTHINYLISFVDNETEFSEVVISKIVKPAK